jgi:N6-adenosine-specific RNA methylase IME4
MTVPAWQFGDPQMFGFDVIIADPPWDFKNYSDAGTLKGADPHYDVMTLDAIKALRVLDLARGDCLLLMWTTGWAMATCQAQDVALGNPRYRPLPSSFDCVAREHSRKPVEFYELVTKHTPSAARCDLFSRETRDGFVGWGNEHGKFDA